MLKINISNLELHKEILETYTQCPSNTNASFDAIQSICKKLDVPISEDYCYMSDLLKYLMDTTEFYLNSVEIDLIESYMEIQHISKDEYFEQSRFFNELIKKDILPTELKKLKIGYVLNKIKESRGE